MLLRGLISPLPGRMHSPAVRLNLWMFATAALILIAIVGLSYRDWTQYQRASANAARTRDVLSSTQTVLLGLDDAETGQRGFLLTGDDQYLEPYKRAVHTIPIELKRLNAFLAESPGEPDTALRLNDLVDRKLADLRRTIDLRRTQGFKPALDAVRSDGGRQLMDKIRGMGIEIQGREEAARVHTVLEREATAKNSFLVTTVGSLILIVFFMVGNSLSNRAIRAREAVEMAGEFEVARRAEELKSAVLDAMAHELRNPLNSVKLAATTLLSGQVGGELHKREMLTIIDEEADRMDRFIEEAVVLSRMEASELTLQKEPQDIARLIPAAVAEMGAAVARRRIQMNLPKVLPLAECDKAMIVRVLKQLLNNALKYSPEDSPLTVSADFTGRAIVIDVVDRGPGVAEEERDRIFEKYYRGRAARSKPGTGLGLTSARAIVQAHGGEIWVTSPPAGGAAFHVSLPVPNGQSTGGGNWALRES
jgi:signal transduction histidine kinase